MNGSRGCEPVARASGSVICPFNSILGLVAQLGAHHIRIVGVEGSNPFESTTSEQAAYRLLRLFMPLAKKSECAHYAAPP